MKEKTTRILIYHLDQKEPEIRTISNTLKAEQEIVGGRIECVHPVSLGSRLVIVCNEEGSILGLPLNISVITGIKDFRGIWTDIRGTAFVIRIKGSEFVSLTDDDIKECKIAIWKYPEVRV